jgi:hypothetical protein
VAGGVPDEDADGIPDSCEYGRGDLNLDGVIDGNDLGLLLALWGELAPPIGDLNGDGVVDANDLGELLSGWAR